MICMKRFALLQTWNGTGPYNPDLDPIVLSEFLELSFHEMSTMKSQGMPGVWTWDFGEAFGHHLHGFHRDESQFHWPWL